MSEERGARVRFPPPLVFVAAIAGGLAASRFGRPMPWPVDRSVAVALGVAFLVAGLALIASARVHFARTKQSPVPWKPSPSLIAAGPYRYTRNPMYVGATAIVLGVGALADNGWIDLLGLFALVVVHVIAVRPEERYLRERFGESYVAYTARVRRYL